jgi:D-3-phosphoglycerate dehydrogenase
MVILLADAFASDLPARLGKFGEVATDLARVSEAEVIIVRSKTKVDKAMIDKAPGLKYVIRGGVGVDTIDVDYAKSKGIVVDNTPEASSLAVAELAFALMISLPNHIAEADASMKQGKWLKKELERTELGGKTLGLVGIGRIARELALRAKAFGMKVIAYDKYVQSSDAATMVSLDEVLAKSDFVSLHTPLTDETRGMMNAAAFAKMKKGAYLINTCRGPVVKTDDVVAALKGGKLGGYATDVYDKEPPEGSPLLSAPHMLLTPHLGASTEENLLRLGDCIVERMQKYGKK